MMMMQMNLKQSCDADKGSDDDGIGNCAYDGLL